MGELWRGMKMGFASRLVRQCAMTTALVCLLLGHTCVGAFEIPTGNEDVQFRWDNTIRYSLANRVEKQDRQLLKNLNTDDGDRNFERGIVGNRIDLLSEMDFIYKRFYGVRISGAFWYDNAYEDLDNKNTVSSNHMENGRPVAGELSVDLERQYLGPYGELLDAFAFGKVDVGDMPINIKAGRHTVYWGESVLFGGALHGISYAQSPLDVAKGLMIPGTEAKELFRPLAQLSVQAQPMSDLTLLGQYYAEWAAYRFPEGGSYLGFSDVFQTNGESYVVSPGQRMIGGADSEPDPFKNFGVAARYSPSWLDGTLGFYYRRFADMIPQLAARPSAATLPAPVGNALGYTRLAAPGTTPAPYAFSAASIPDIQQGRVGYYYQCYAEDIDMLAVSLAKQVLDVSVGLELSYRWDMPLNSRAVNIVPPELYALLGKPPGYMDHVPTDGEIPGARGNTWHSVLSLIGLTSDTPLFDSASWVVEFVWSRLDRVTENAAVFKAPRSGYNEIDAATLDYFGGAVNFTPTWYQVFAGVDMTMPLSYSQGLSGNSAVLAGGNEDSGSWSAGIAFDVFNEYKFDFRYVDIFGRISERAQPIPNGSATAGLKDRDMVIFTFTTKF